MKLAKHLWVLLAILFFSGFSHGELTDWQSTSSFRPCRINTNLPRQYKVGGPRPQAITCLGSALEYEPGHWPRLTRRRIPWLGTSARSNRELAFSLGHIAISGEAPKKFNLENISFSNTAVTFTAGDGKSLYFSMSRATPVCLLQTDAASIRFFAGEDSPKPKYIAAEFEGSVTIKGADEVSQFDGKLGQGSWILVWFGKTHESSRFSIYTPLPYPADCPVLLFFQNAPKTLATDDGLAIDFESQVGRIAMLPLFGDNYPLADFDEKLLSQPYKTRGGAYSSYDYGGGPLRKYSIPETSFNTDLWAEGLPEDVLILCRWWAEHLHQVPVVAKETYFYDPNSDTVTISESFLFSKLAEGGTTFAPLPPTLALAARYGFPIEFSDKLIHVNHLTAHGPLVGIENTPQYTWKIKGLGRYIKPAENKLNLDNAPEELRDELDAQVKAIIDAGPYLAPWYPVLMNFGAGYKNYYRRGYEGHFLWQNPAETLYYLAQAYPVLSKKTQRRVEKYLKALYKKYPPAEQTLLKFEDGAPREHYTRPPESVVNRLNERWAERNFYHLHEIVPDKSVYYAACYYSLRRIKGASKEETAEILSVLEPYLACLDWGTMGYFRRPHPWHDRQGSGGTMDINDQFAALLGAVRLSDRPEFATENVMYRGLFAKAAALRFAMGKHSLYLYESGLLNTPKERDWMFQLLAGSWRGFLYTADWMGPRDEAGTVWRLDQFGVTVHEGRQVSGHKECPGLVHFVEITPELGLFAGDFLKAECAGLMRRVDEVMPAWYTAYCPAVQSFETNIQPPEDSHQLFLLNAWALDATGEQLQWWRDIPWLARGDLFYVQKLTETIKAYAK